MAADHSCNACSHGIDIEHIKIVNDVYQCGTYLNGIRLRQAAGPVAPVNVAPYGGHVGKRAEGIQNIQRVEVPRVDDVVDAREQVNGLGPEQTVRVGYDANYRFLFHGQTSACDRVILGLTTRVGLLDGCG